MGLGDKISQWLNEKTPVGDVSKYIKDSGERLKETQELGNSFSQRGTLETIYVHVALPLTMIFAVLFHVVEPDFFYPSNILTTVPQDYSKVIAAVLRQGVETPALRELLEVMGALISEPLFGILENYAKQEEPDYQEFLRSFYGYLMLVPILGGAVNALGSFISLGQVNNLGKPITDSFWTMGLGFMGWQGISPLLTASVLEGMTRRANSQFRPKRMTTSEGLQLFNADLIVEGELLKTLIEQGWRDKDIPKVIELAYRKFSDGQLFDLWDNGLIVESELRTRLRRNGWSASDINLRIANHSTDKTSVSKSVSLSTAKKALKLLIITRNEFTDLLRDANYTDEAIALELAIIDFQTEVENKELSVGQLRQAYMENQIIQTEVIIGLRDIGYSNQNAEIIFQTWQAGKAPKILRLNQANITRASVEGVISADEGLQKLVSLGVVRGDAEIIINSLGLRGGGNRKLPSDAQLLGAMQAEIITQAVVLERLLVRGYTALDAQLIIDLTLSFDVLSPDAADISDAFLLDVLTEDKTRELLKGIGATPDFIEIRIDTLLRQKARLTRQPNPSEIAKWLRHGLINREKALELLEGNFYTLETANLFLDAIGLETPKALGQNSIEEALEFEIITQNEALTLFFRLGISEEDSQIIIKVILERVKRDTPKATISALLDAARKEIITLDELATKLEAFRLPDDQIETYIALASLEATAENVKLSKTDILKLYSASDIRRFKAVSFLEAKGYSLEEAELLIKLERKEITDSLVNDLLINNYITNAAARFLLEQEGFTNEEINEYLEESAAA